MHLPLDSNYGHDIIIVQDSVSCQSVNFLFCRFEKIDLNPVHARSSSENQGCLQFKIFQNFKICQIWKAFYPADQKYLFKHSKIRKIYNLIHFLIINFTYRLVTMVNCEIEKTWWNEIFKGPQSEIRKHYYLLSLILNLIKWWNLS